MPGWHGTTTVSYRERQADWLLDPLNVHKIVGSRKNADTRYAQISIVRCLLEYADTEFATDTSESVARARRLYRQALKVLNAAELRRSADACESLTTTLETLVASATVHTVSSDRPWWPLLEELLQRVREFDEYQQRLVVVEEVRNILTTPEPLEDDELSGRLLSALKVVDDHERPATDGQVMSDVIDERTVAMPEPYAALLADDWTVRNTESISKISADRQIGAHVGMSHSSVFDRQRGVLQTIVSLPYQFCVPRNPILAALRERAESNLRKIRDCRNFAGIRRQLEPYAVPTGVENGLPKFSDDELSLLGTRSMQPTPYRYSTLISRAKELANLAHQFEESFLAKLERLYAEEYTLLNARQDVERSRANVELQGLRMSQAQEEVSLAELQRDRAQVTLDHYKNLFDNGLLPSESASLRGAHIGASLNLLSSLFSGFSGVSGAASSFSSADAMQASFQRRQQEWVHQQNLANQDVAIGAQQIDIALIRADIVQQEYGIAEIQSDHAGDMAEFLNEKFTNTQLYEWMSGILEDVFRYFLQQATAMAGLAREPARVRKT